MSYSAAILAGGFSRRFGQDKAIFQYRGKALLDWVADSFSEADERFIVANRTYPTLPVYADLLQVQTPLSGVHSALSHARCDWVAIAACDMPNLTAEYWRRLWAFRQDARIVLVQHDGGLEPLAGFYHKSLTLEIERLVVEGELSVQSLLKAVPPKTVRLSWLELEKDIFKNLNFPEDESGKPDSYSNFTNKSH